jgi:hypothetical protein
VNWSYIAGFFDGEGSIHMPMGFKKLKRPTVVIYQTDKGVLLQIQEFIKQFGINSTLDDVQYKNHWTKKLIYRLRPHALVDVRKFLYHIAPHLILKRQLAEDAWRWARVYPALTRQQCKILQVEASTAAMRRRWAR